MKENTESAHFGVKMVIIVLFDPKDTSQLGQDLPLITNVLTNVLFFTSIH